MLLHLTLFVEYFGPLWTHSAFCFEGQMQKNSACHPESSSSMIFVGIMATIWIFSVWILKLFCIKNFLFDGYILLQPCNFRDWYSTGKVLVQYRKGVDSALINWRFNAEGKILLHGISRRYRTSYACTVSQQTRKLSVPLLYTFTVQGQLFGCVIDFASIFYLHTRGELCS